MSDTTDQTDLAIVGAGPAGMAAAVEARRHGLSVTLLDEQPSPGGQIWRAIERTDDRRRRLLGADYARGADLARELRDSRARYRPGATVWNIEEGWHLDYSCGGGAHGVTAGALIVATGANERPVPVPGWTLPGVTSAGAMQILLKAHGGIKPGLVLAGNGPLLWLIAQQMVAAGSPPAALVETVPRGRYLRALTRLPGALRGHSDLRKGLAMMRTVQRAGVRIYLHASDLRIEGKEHAEALSFRQGGRSRRLETGAIALHEGVVPNQQITRLLRCDHRWNAEQHCFEPVLDGTGRTSKRSLWIAGDGAGIAGADAAVLRGRIAAAAVARASGKKVSTGDLERQLTRITAARPFLDKLYQPTTKTRRPDDGTIICRCEEVTAGAVRKALSDGAPGPNQLKSFLRAGMGPCQGRMCGLAVSELTAEAMGRPPQEEDYYRIRPPLKPLPLAELADAAE